MSVPSRLILECQLVLSVFWQNKRKHIKAGISIFHRALASQFLFFYSLLYDKRGLSPKVIVWYIQLSCVLPVICSRSNYYCQRVDSKYSVRAVTIVSALELPVFIYAQIFILDKHMLLAEYGVICCDFDTTGVFDVLCRVQKLNKCMKC